MTAFFPLPTLAQPKTLYTVGCSCGWRHTDDAEEWAETMARLHAAEHNNVVAMGKAAGG